MPKRIIFYTSDINAEILKKTESGLYPLDQIKKFTKNHRLAGSNP